MTGGNRTQFLHDVIAEISRQSVDRGKLLEIGWLAFDRACIPPECPPDARKLMKLAYFAGCEHLFSTIMVVLDPGGEPTARDLARMSKIQAEVDFWHSVLSATFMPAKGSA